MAVLFVEGFESYGAIGATGTTLENNLIKGWDFAATTYFTSTVIAMGRGDMGSSLQWFGGWGHNIKKYLPASQEWYIGWAQKTTEGALANENIVLSMWDGSIEKIRVYLQDDGSIEFYRYGTLLSATDAGILRPWQWYYIEVYVKIDDTVGAYEVRVNGQTVLSASGVDTQQGTSSVINTFVFHTCFAGLDDIYIADASDGQTFLGEMKVETLKPMADTAQADWAPSTGSDNYALLDDESLDDADYVSASTLDEKDLYDFETLSYLVGGIKAVQISTAAHITGARARDLIPLIKSGATEQDGDTISISGNSSLQYHAVFGIDPNTALDWLVADINTLQAGMKVG